MRQKSVIKRPIRKFKFQSNSDLKCFLEPRIFISGVFFFVFCIFYDPFITLRFFTRLFTTDLLMFSAFQNSIILIVFIIRLKFLYETFLPSFFSLTSSKNVSLGQIINFSHFGVFFFFKRMTSSLVMSLNPKHYNSQSPLLPDSP